MNIDIDGTMAVAVEAGLSGGTLLYALGDSAVLGGAGVLGSVVQKASSIAITTTKAHTKYDPRQSTKSYTIYSRHQQPGRTWVEHRNDHRTTESVPSELLLPGC